MFSIGPTELLVIAVVGLMLFSPRELPKIIRSVAKFWGSIRNTADDFKDAIMDAEFQDDLKDVKGVFKGAKATVRKAEMDARRELMKARMEMRRAEAKLNRAGKVGEEIARKEAAGEALGAETSSDEAEPAAEPASAAEAHLPESDASPTVTADAGDADGAPAAAPKAPPMPADPAVPRAPAVPPPPQTGRPTAAAADSNESPANQGVA